MEITQEGTVIGVMNDYLRAVEARDVEAVMSYFAPTAFGFGTGADEKYSEPGQFRAGIKRDFAQSGSMRFVLISTKVGISGPVAWVAAEVEIHVEIPGQGEMAFPARGSLVLQEYDGRWLFEHSHLSVPAGNQQEGESF